MGIRNIQYEAVSCDSRSHHGPESRNIANDKEFHNLSQHGLVFCDACWSSMSKEDLCKLLNISYLYRTAINDRQI